MFYQNATVSAFYVDVALSVFLFGLLVVLLMCLIKNIKTLNRHLSPSAFYVIVSKLFKPSAWLCLPIWAVLAFLWYRFLAMLSFVGGLDVGAMGFTLIFGGLSLLLAYFVVLLTLSIVKGQQMFPPTPAKPKPS